MLHIERNDTMKVTFFDVEYANARNKSICQIGILSRELDNPDSEISKLDLYVNPEDGFDDNCVRIHGITSDAVNNSPTFRDVWADIEQYFTNAVIIGHNVASADLDALHKNLVRYGIEVPEIYYVCTYQLAKELVPSFTVADYGLGTLCTFFGINITEKHNALYDACACSDLLDKLVDYSKIDIESEIQRYIPSDHADFIAYISNASLKKDIHALYGMIRGFSLDSKISDEEKEYIKTWRETFSLYKNHQDVSTIISVIDNILEDDVITIDEINKLQLTIRKHLDIVSTSTITLATQILNGIIKGIITDETITEEECQNLSAWLYENNYLAGHFPFDKLYGEIESVLADGILTPSEASIIKNEINNLLDPVESLRKDVMSLKGKRICLSGNFAFGQKSAVEQYIIEQGGIIDSSVKKTTDILVVGDYECKSYSNGTYGTKVKKAIEYNGKGGNIQISKESDIIKPTKSFSEVLFDFIDKSGLSDAEVYKKAQLPRQMMSKIKCVPNYLPSKQNICAFAIALELTVEQANELLSSAGYVLSRSFEFDRIIEDAIVHGNYDIFSINEKMYELGILWLGAK